MELKYLSILSGILLLFLQTNKLSAQNSVSGKVVDKELQQPVFGANLIIQGTYSGTSTDENGNFMLTSAKPFPWTIDVTYIGFEAQSIVVEENSTELNIVLKPTFVIGQEIVVSASRKQEKMLNAPASITVLGKRQLSVSPQINPIRNLITVPGVQIQQQSAGRMHISMRGQADLFATDVFPIMDYRSLIAPGSGFFSSLKAGVSSVDLQQIEVIRGPGSALYGPGVTAGVIHFITKNPIDFPGTTVELFGGEGSTYGFMARHAGKSQNNKFGYKINAQYTRGDEFQLDLEEDAAQIAKLQSTIRLPSVSNNVIDASQAGEIVWGPEDTDPDGDGNPMQDHYWSRSLNGTLEFRPQNDMNITASGGLNQGSQIFYNAQGEGLNQSYEYWLQTRVQKGNLFAQLFYLDNDGGGTDRPTFLYQSGLVGAVAYKQLEGQVQYSFDVPTLLDANFTVGVDSRSTVSDSENLVFGRNENDDDFNTLGAYIQGDFKLSNKLDMVLAGRYDQYNFVNEGSFTPRMALVYKPNPLNTFRISYNRSTRPSSALDLNFDFPLATPVPGLFDLWTAGSKNPHTFPNPVIDVTIPGVPDLPINTPGLPLAIPFGLINESVIQGIVSSLGNDPILNQLIPVITAYLQDPANVPQGHTGSLNAYNIFSNQPFGPLQSIEAAQIATYENYEIGYKGLWNNKLSIMADLYYIRRKGFALFDAVGPTYSLTGADISTDLGNAIEQGIAPILIEELLPLLGENAEQTAALLASQIASAYSTGGAAAQAQLEPLFGIFGTVESSLIPQGDGIAHVPVGFRTDPNTRIGYWGADVALEYYINNDFSVYGNYSWKSRAHWGPGNSEEFDGELPFVFTLTVPRHKYRLGLTYAPEGGFFGSLSFQRDNAFYGQTGQFQGITGPTNVFDGALGYRFNDNLQITLAATNLFDTPYRAFVNFPEIRRRALVKLLYDFPLASKK